MVKIHWRNHWANFNQTWHFWVKGIQVSSNVKGPVIFHGEIILQNSDNTLTKLQKFSSSFCLLIWTVFSGERCGPWAPCLLNYGRAVRCVCSVFKQYFGKWVKIILLLFLSIIWQRVWWIVEFLLSKF